MWGPIFGPKKRKGNTFWLSILNCYTSRWYPPCLFRSNSEVICGLQGVPRSPLFWVNMLLRGFLFAYLRIGGASCSLWFWGLPAVGFQEKGVLMLFDRCSREKAFVKMEVLLCLFNTNLQIDPGSSVGILNSDHTPVERLEHGPWRAHGGMLKVGSRTLYQLQPVCHVHISLPMQWITVF